MDTAQGAVEKQADRRPLFDPDARTWARKLFSRSPLKQRKWRQLGRMMDPPNGKVSLDVGSDNGVISMLLREQGGEWYSADLIPETVTAIRTLVGDRVLQIDGERLPFEDSLFDQILIVDFLEHVETDELFVSELYRTLKPGGTLVINVPNPKNGLMRAIKNRLGNTDEAHGHVPPGYTKPALEKLLGERFAIERHESYSRVFSDLIDTAITAVLDILKGNRGKKGTVVTGADLTKLQKSFRLYSLIYPVVAFFAALDNLVPFLHGNMLIARCRSRKV